jgi:hypothetical protein
VNTKLSRRLGELEDCVSRHRARQERRAKDAERFAQMLERASVKERAEIERILEYRDAVAVRLGLKRPWSDQDERRVIKEIPVPMRRRYLEILKKYDDLPDKVETPTESTKS